ncbi:MAG: GTPase Era [Saprospiraceae bacterium]|nr:GTPase Era [Saprospiraceae bacterium]
MFKSGFVNIIGRPNVGKSTLTNALVGEDMSIITYKPQTTRHRILGIVTGDNFQMIFSDTPGFVHDPSYKMHEKMNRYVHTTFEDADIMLLVVDHEDRYQEDHILIRKLKSLACPIFIIINKIDLLQDAESLKQIESHYEKLLPSALIFTISALKGQNISQLYDKLLSSLPEGPAYFPADQLSDRTERFFVSEMIRENIFLLYHEEVPYSCEVVVESFKDEPDLVRIEAIIFVSRKTQQAILIGKGGRAIKQLGIDSRLKIEAFLEKKVFLQLRVKVREDWRNNDQLLQRLGYNQ